MLRKAIDELNEVLHSLAREEEGCVNIIKLHPESEKFYRKEIRKLHRCHNFVSKSIDTLHYYHKIL